MDFFCRRPASLHPLSPLYFDFCSCTELFQQFPGLKDIWSKPQQLLFFRQNLLWMFITFHKQVSVIKPTLPHFSIKFSLQITFYQPCNILCIFKHSCFLVFLLKFWILLSSMSSSLLIWWRASTKRDIFCNNLCT